MAAPSTLLQSLFITVMTAALLTGGNAVAKPANTLAETCKEVVINGYRSMSYSCLGQAMTPSTLGAQRSTSLPASDISQKQPNNNGLFSQSALRNRMGNNLGKSVTPQRPPNAQP